MHLSIATIATINTVDCFQIDGFLAALTCSISTTSLICAPRFVAIENAALHLPRSIAILIPAAPSLPISAVVSGTVSARCIAIAVN